MITSNALAERVYTTALGAAINRVARLPLDVPPITHPIISANVAQYTLIEGLLDVPESQLSEVMFALRRRLRAQLPATRHNDTPTTEA